MPRRKPPAPDPSREALDAVREAKRPGPSASPSEPQAAKGSGSSDLNTPTAAVVDRRPSERHGPQATRPSPTASTASARVEPFDRREHPRLVRRSGPRTRISPHPRPAASLAGHRDARASTSYTGYDHTLSNCVRHPCDVRSNRLRPDRPTPRNRNNSQANSRHLQRNYELPILPHAEPKSPRSPDPTPFPIAPTRSEPPGPLFVAQLLIFAKRHPKTLFPP